LLKTPIYGSFEWKIPNVYRKKDGTTDHWFTETTQKFNYVAPPPDPLGKGFISKETVGPLEFIATP